MEPGPAGIVSGAPVWPGGARGALSLSFDNLGEAAELQLGAIEPGAPLGGHFTATQVLPSVLDRLKARNLTATFFVEGLNTELYPDELAAIEAGGHELGYHAWRHEQWADLSASEQAENLERGLAGFRRLGMEVTGLRPPGGLLGPGGLDVLRGAGLRYCSPAGEGAGEDGGIALLPFQWRHLDASCVLPPLAGAREQMTGSPDPVDPGAFLASLEQAIGNLARSGGYLAIVLHPFMLDWLGDERLAALLDRIAVASERGEFWVSRCADVAAHVLAHPEAFRDGTILDPTSWADAG
jgi:peptidoglycan/xylan/chitin deacetylase (PgdA/CDA1 family)